LKDETISAVATLAAVEVSRSNQAHLVVQESLIEKQTAPERQSSDAEDAYERPISDDGLERRSECH
jgi:hypothetical protein